MLTAVPATVSQLLPDSVFRSVSEDSALGKVARDVETHVSPHLPVKNFVATPALQRHLFEPGQFLSEPSSAEPLEIARNFLTDRAAELGLVPSQLEQARVTDQYISQPTGVRHIYFRQTLDGLDLAGAYININVNADGRVINAGSSFFASAGVDEQLHPSLSARSALQVLATELDWPGAASPLVLGAARGLEQATLLDGDGLSLDDVPANLEYVLQPDGSVELAWRFVVRTEDHWYDASISAYEGELVRIDDWVAHASYNVFASPLRHPDDGNRSQVVNPQDSAASPFGWHDTDGVDGAEFTDTRGNNVFAQEDRDGNDSGGSRPDGGAGLDFNFPLDLSLEPVDYQDAAITNLFYWNNVLHDIHYKYGFDEVAGNFQQSNYGNGGLGGDPILADAQDGAADGRFNNAFFGTPPDGGQPILTMLEFNSTSPHRDSDLENTIIIHEYGHGVSTRLTGGPSNVGALSALQSRGMGEGWSDWWSLMLTQEPVDQQLDAYPVGTYVLGQSTTDRGIRRQPYSFDMNVDPRTYGDFNTDNESHRAGEIWASALWDLNWLLINGDGGNLPARGFDPDFYNGTGGNNLALRLVMDGLKLQPANPSFLDGRDAILLADLVANSGANQLAIWTAYARRGMGFSANDGGSGSAETVVEAFDLPPASAGTVELDADHYEVGDLVTVTVRDGDLTGGGPIQVSLVSNGGDRESLALAELGSGVFQGSLGTSSILAAAIGDGALNIAPGDIITATYNDADNGSGSSAEVSDTANIIAIVEIFGQDFESGLGSHETLAGNFAINNSNAPLNNGTMMLGHPTTYSDREYSYYEFSLDLTGVTLAELQFDYAAQIEAFWDGFNVQASSAAISPPANLITSASGLPYGVSSGESLQIGGTAYDANGSLDTGTAVFDLSEFAGQTLFVRLQFGSDRSLTNPGINIDNLSVRGARNGNSAVHGQKWSDLDGDGQRDVGEPGLNGWEIQLFDGPSLVTTQTTTDIDLDGDGSIDPETERGLYRFTGLEAGTYTVSESAQPGWTQTSTARGDAEIWTPLGPAPIRAAETPGNTNVSGRVVAIAPHPTDANTVYAGGAHGGVWRTIDGGLSWTPLTDEAVTLATGAIAVSASNPDVIYAGTGEANFSVDSFYGRGILKSTDAGNSWTLLGQSQFDRRTVSEIVVHPSDPNTVYVGVARGANGLPGNQGVWKSSDGGVTWTNTTASISGSVPVTDLVMNPTNPDTLLAGYGDVFGDASNGLYRTTDAGANWSAVGVGVLPAGTTAGRVNLAISSSGQTVYAAWQDPGANFGALLGFFQSIDGGISWIDRTASTPNYVGSQGWYDNVLVVDPTDANRVFVGGAGGSNSLLRSDSGGANWTDISVGTDGRGPHANHHALAFDAKGNLLDGNDGGIWRTSNQGGLWDSLNTTLSLTQFYDVAVHPTKKDVVFGGTQANGTIKFNGLDAWNHIASGDGGVVQVDFNNPDVVYHEFQYSGAGFLRRSNDGGTSFNSKTTGIDTSDPGRFIIPYELDPANPIRLVLGTNRVYQSADRGNSWAAISPVLGTGVVAALDIAASDLNTIYVAYTDGSVFATFDGGANWEQRDTNLPGPPTSGIYSGPNFGDPAGPELIPPGLSGNVGIADFAIDPSNNQTVYLVRDTFGSGQIWKTIDGGLAWADISGNLPDLPAHSIAIDPRLDPDVLYVALDTGVFRSVDSGTTWEQFGTGLPNTIAKDLEINLDLSQLTVGTHGRGAWRIDLDDAYGLNVEKLSQVRFAEIPGGSTRANDLTGYVSPSGQEYAIIGLQKGTGYINVSDPQNPVVVAFVAGSDEASSRPHDSAHIDTAKDAHSHAKCHDGCEGASTWRDIKTVGQHAYVTNETRGGLQVIDLAAIDSGTVTAVGTLTESGLQTAHNVGLNPDSGFAFLVGPNIANGGIVAVDLADPANPQIAGTWAETYVHDIELVSYTSGPFAGREIAYAFAAGVGVVVVDVTDKANMFTIATGTYPNLAYTHYGAITEDLQYLFVNDELDEVRSNVSTTTTYILDVSDPANPTYLTSFTTGLPAIDHNLRVRGDFLFEVNYRSGLRVFDISDISDVQEIGYYDTYPADDEAHFNGTWGVYSGLPSGVVLVSDIEQGLFVLDPSAAKGEHLVVLGADETAEAINFGNHELPTVTLAVDTGVVAEDEGVAAFTATLSAPAALPVTIDLTFSGSATLTEDYTSSATQIVIAVGETSGTTTVTAVQDTVAEADETVIVAIGDVSNATESGNQLQTIAIADDDPAPTLQGMAINGTGNPNRSAIAKLALRFDQAVVVNGVSSLSVFNHTTSSPLDISAATLQNNGSSEVTWNFSGVSFPDGFYSVELSKNEAASVQGKPLAATRSFRLHVLPGDSTGDGHVDFLDFSELASSFNTINGPILGPGDLDANGNVDFADFAILAGNFNRVLSPLALDFGDVPETGTSLATILENNGARHVLGSNLVLGSTVDHEADGQPDADAQGDDNAGDDEDGVTFGALQAGANANVAVTALVPAGQTAVLNAWIDFNADGDWDDGGEQVFVDRALSDGPNSLAVAVPSGAVAGQAFARFRVTSSPGYTYDGLAQDGEVEDYRITIAAGFSSRIQTAAATIVELRAGAWPNSSGHEARATPADETSNRPATAETTQYQLDQLAPVDAEAIQRAGESLGHTALEVAEPASLLDERLVDRVFEEELLSASAH